MRRRRIYASDCETMNKSFGVKSSFACLLAGVFAILLVDMLNRWGLGFHLSISDRMALFVQPPTQALLLTGFLFGLGRFARGITLCVVGWLIFFELTDIFCRFCLGLHLSKDIFLILHGSSPQEMKMFLHDYIGLKLMGLLSCWTACFLVVVWFVRKFSYPRADLSRGIVSGGCLLALIVLWTGGFKVNALMYSSVISGTVRNLGTIADQMQLAESPDVDSRFGIFAETPPVGVVVIGESSSRNHWGLYGYPRETTPKIGKLQNELVAFSNLVCVAPTTQPSLRWLMTLATVEAPEKGVMSFPWALSQAGYVSYLYSAQPKWGTDENMITLLFKPSLERGYLSEKITGRFFDEALLPYVDDFCRRSKNEKASFLFLHLAGSHFPWEKAYPSNKAFFAPGLRDDVTMGLDEKRCTYVNHYDNSIRYTDSVLAQVIAKVRALCRPAFVVYVSDHGETPLAGSMRNESDPDCWEIPLIVWLSPEYRKTFPDVCARLSGRSAMPLQSDQLFYGFLDLARVTEEPGERMHRNDFLSPEFKPRQRRMISCGEVCYEELFYGRREP